MGMSNDTIRLCIDLGAIDHRDENGKVRLRSTDGSSSDTDVGAASDRCDLESWYVPTR